MAGIILLGVPLAVGFITGPMMLVTMRSIGLSTPQRALVDFTVLAIGTFIVSKGFNNKKTDNILENLFIVLGGLILVSMAAFAAVDGIIWDIGTLIVKYIT
eukprot:PhF_6_TR32742/c0_g1_i2/m.48303